MIILPIGHDKEIFHFPHVTVGIMALCLAVQIYATVTDPGDEERAQLIRQEMQLRLRIWVEHGEAWVEQNHPELLQKKRPRSPAELMARVKELSLARRAFFEAVERDEVLEPDDPLRRQYRELKQRRTRQAGVLSLGYHWSGGLHTLVTYAFVHAGWFHLIGNMIFLYLCGCNIEDRWGRWVWLLLYVAGGAAAALTWGGLHRASPGPLVGASGAVAAAMGAFLILNHRASIQFWYLLWWFTYPVKGTFHLRAYWALPLWLVQQVIGMWLEGTTAPVAYSAHVGGFAFGALVAVGMKLLGADRRLHAASEHKATLYSEHPLMLRALEQLRREDRRGAEATLRALLAEQPDHLDAALELYRLLQEPQEAARAASRAVVLARRAGDLHAAAGVYTDLGQRYPGVSLDDRGLFAVAEAFERSGDPRAAVAVYEQLVDAHPDSPVAPRALLNMALLHRDRLNDANRARQALTRVLQQHGDTAFGERARELLAALA